MDERNIQLPAHLPYTQALFRQVFGTYRVPVPTRPGYTMSALLFRDRYGISVIDGSGESIGSIPFSGDFDQARAIGDTVVVTDRRYSYTYSRRGDLIRTRPR
jgi:hypothetical protein